MDSSEAVRRDRSSQSTVARTSSAASHAASCAYIAIRSVPIEAFPSSPTTIMRNAVGTNASFTASTSNVAVAIRTGVCSPRASASTQAFAVGLRLTKRASATTRASPISRIPA